jgi:FdhE protein
MSTLSDALTEAARQEPALASYYELYRRLFELHEELEAGLTATLELAEQESLQARVLQGMPQVSFSQLPIEADRFAGLAEVVAKLLADYYAPEGRIEGGLPADAPAWIALAQKRFEEGQARLQQSKPRDANLAEMTVDQALTPYLVWAADQVLPHLDLQQWLRTYCPVCGGAPDMAFLSGEAGVRHLLCSRCNSQWLARRLGCPFCGAGDHEAVYYASDDEVHRLYVCEACRRYLKSVDRRKTGGRPVLPEVERVTTVAMDVSARQAGYQ